MYAAVYNNSVKGEPNASSLYKAPGVFGFDGGEEGR